MNSGIHPKKINHAPKIISVVHFQRNPMDQQVSLERVFETVRTHLPKFIHAQVKVVPFKKGVIGRIANIIFGFHNQGRVNHITGDIFYLASLMMKKNTLLTYHDCDPLWRRKGFRRWIVFFFWFWLPSKCCAAITAVSQFTKEELIQILRCDPSKIRVIHDPLADVFKKKPKSFNRIKPRILQVGTDPKKNAGRVISALEGIPCHFRIIGKISEEELRLLLDKKLEYSNVPYLAQPKVFLEMSQCDLLVFASIYEGFGLPIIEANAVGRAVVTSNLGPMPEVAGEAACLVDPYDVQSIRKGVLKVIHDTSYRKHLIANGYKNAKRFDPKKIAGKYADLYKETLSGDGL